MHGAGNRPAEEWQTYPCRVSRTRRADPPPLETDDVRIVGLGTALWVVALVVCLLLRDRLSANGHDSWVWVALAGAFLGLVGLRYVVRRRSALRRDAAAAAPREPLT
ncbi:MAG: hypothetical protein QOJ90_457 [Actinomycetota bacterium]|jgi:hypothetical protein|nr:hypothetical protein [Actinomycetota bacterium]